MSSPARSFQSDEPNRLSASYSSGLMMAFGMLGKKDSGALGSPQRTNSSFSMLNSLLSSRLVPIMMGTWFHEGSRSAPRMPSG